MARVLKSPLKHIALAGVACLVMVAAGCGSDDESGATDASDLERVNVRLDGFFWAGHVPLLVGIEQGIFERHGLDVKPMKGSGSATTIQTVANGSDDIGFADGGTAAVLVSKGAKVQMFMGQLQQNPMVVLAWPESGIDEPADLAGKSGGFTVDSSTEALFPAFAASAGLDPDSPKFVQVDLQTRDSLFMQKETDFTFGYSITQQVLFEEECNCELKVFRYADYDVNSINAGYIVGEEFAAESAATLEAFTSAMQESTQLAIDDPDQAVEDFFNYVKEDTAFSESAIAAGWTEIIGLLKAPSNPDLPVGCMTDQDWADTIELLTQYRGVADGSVEPGDVFTNEYFEPSSCDE